MAETKMEICLASKKEKNPKIRSRMLAVRMARIRGIGVGEAAANLTQSANRVRMWLPMSGYFRTFADMRNAASLYFRTARLNLDITKYANRKAALFSRNT